MPHAIAALRFAALLISQPSQSCQSGTAATASERLLQSLQHLSPHITTFCSIPMGSAARAKRPNISPHFLTKCLRAREREPPGVERNVVSYEMRRKLEYAGTLYGLCLHTRVCGWCGEMRHRPRASVGWPLPWPDSCRRHGSCTSSCWRGTCMRMQCACRLRGCHSDSWVRSAGAGPLDGIKSEL